MPTLQRAPGEPPPDGHKGEVSACCFTPDGRSVLSGGWDGHLRLWDTGARAPVTALRVGAKPVSACAVSPDGTQWLAGNLDGLLSRWDPLTQKLHSTFLAHPRPLAAIVFGPDGHLATASWDASLVLWGASYEREGRTLRGHTDIVAGCQFTPDGKGLLSWSHDGTARLWDVARGALQKTFAGHADRIHCGAVSPDGAWAGSASRDGQVRLWDLQSGREAASLILDGDVRGCHFLPHGGVLATVEADGHVRLHTVPELEGEAELGTGLTVECSAVAPDGGLIALGAGDGRVHLVQVQGYESAPLYVSAIRSTRQTATALGRLLGRTRTVAVYDCVCPTCRRPAELPHADPGRPASCPHCGRSLRVRPALPRPAVTAS
jgi:WD40 repeat protein